MDVLCKYLDNLIEHPGEEKFRKIRLANKAFQVHTGVNVLLRFCECGHTHTHTHTHKLNQAICLFSVHRKG